MRLGAGIFVVLLLLSGTIPASAQRSDADGQWHSFKSSPNYDVQAEAVLLQMANQARAEAGVPPLQLDEGLTNAARKHSQAMARAHKIGHQMEGEPGLLARFSAATQLTLEREGENVALDQDARGAAEGLMASAPHRHNLLDPGFNVVGMGAVREGTHLWVTQDFGGSVAVYSADDAEGVVASAVEKFRTKVGLPELDRVKELGLRQDACSMAKSDGLWTQDTHKLTQHYEVVTYTSMHPEVLPGEATGFLSNRRTSTFAVAACHARTATYPTGVYWIMLLFR
jgi:uncharacterized protein YkwD